MPRPPPERKTPTVSPKKCPLYRLKTPAAPPERKKRRSRAYERTIAPHLALFPADLSAKRHSRTYERRLFAQWKPPYAKDGRNRRLPCAEDEKQKKERPGERAFFFLRQKVTEGGGAPFGALPYRLIGEKAAMLLPPPFCLPARDTRRRG